MPFPDSPRVIYAKNPLTEVICQLRFPAILRIDSEAPVAFQERIRHEYPLYQKGIRQELFLSSLPGPVAEGVEGGPGLGPLSGAHDFISADGCWTVGLTREFLALSTRNYLRWEEFRQHLELPLRSLTEVYTPPFFSRVGLRYQDVIVRSRLGLEESGWPELLRPYIVAELGSSDISGSVEAAVRFIIIHLEQTGGLVRIQHGLAQHPGTGESCYLIDSDFFIEGQTGGRDVETTLNAFNAQAGRLFRWCITEKLHLAMEPQPL